MKVIKPITSLIALFLLVISSIIFAATLFINNQFSNQSVDEMFFYLFNGLDGSSKDVIIDAIIKSCIPFFITFFILFVPIVPLKRNNIMEIECRKKQVKFTLLPNKWVYKFRLIYALLMLTLSVMVGYYSLGVKEYFHRLSSNSSIFEDYYVNGQDVSITFPDEKRNLVILYLESIENTLLDRENGGGWEYSVIPELEQIASENINFSNSDKIGGALPTKGTGWTVAGLVSTTAGIPLKIPIDGNDYTSSDNFLAGAYTLGDVLQKEGYNLSLMFGSDANFGGRSNYYLKHGNYEIFDLYTAINEGKMDESEQVWWGFDDTHLFTWAKEKITELASLEEPFSFSFLTANTHFPDGYLESGAENLYESQYENVYAYSSKQVAEFVAWFQEQDFYENTTLVILGDHHSMQDAEFFNSHTYKGYHRTIYNAVINSPIEPINPKNRLFSSLDMYPTLLASIGVEIEGDRLGLGTNLFSDRKTLAEELGRDLLNEEIEKNSHFYNQYILMDDYINLLHQAEQ